MALCGHFAAEKSLDLTYERLHGDSEHRMMIHGE